MRHFVLAVCHLLYLHIAKPIFFLFDAEDVHNFVLSLGNLLGRIRPVCWLISSITVTKSAKISQTIGGIKFSNPIGLAAGFDYEARLTQFMPAVGFGFSTVGTVTNQPYEGNTKPRLGRLKKSRALLVNKGFKNLGIFGTLQKLKGTQFAIPIGISIGVTNTSSIATQKAAIQDIVSAFIASENSSVPFSYYELNISCPNLKVGVDFYSPQHLDRLLSAVTENNLRRPLFVKMPIDKSNEEVLGMLGVIVKYPVQGVIFGNLQKNKLDPSLDPAEVANFTKGFYSGKPTEKRSNELISLAYKAYGHKLTIIGCGGVFSAADAYKKIKLGASLVQLITGMIYEGPQLVAEINLGLLDLLEHDGFGNVAEAVGVENMV